MLAAANPIGGHYNRGKTIAENLKVGGKALGQGNRAFLAACRLPGCLAPLPSCVAAAADGGGGGMWCCRLRFFHGLLWFQDWHHDVVCHGNNRPNLLRFFTDANASRDDDGITFFAAARRHKEKRTRLLARPCMHPALYLHRFYRI